MLKAVSIASSLFLVSIGPSLSGVHHLLPLLLGIPSLLIRHRRPHRALLGLSGR